MTDVLAYMLNHENVRIFANDFVCVRNLLSFVTLGGTNSL